MSKAAAAQRALGLRIKELRMERGYTQAEFAAELGMHLQNYARIEQGRLDVRVSTVFRLAQSLDVASHELFLAPTLRRAKPGRPKKSG